MQERIADNSRPEKVAPGGNISATDTETLADYFATESKEDTREAPLHREQGSIGSIRTFKGLEALAQWSLPAEFSVWQKLGAHVIEVLHDLPNGQPELPAPDDRGYFIFVVREGHEAEDRNAAWDAYEADPSYGQTFVPFRWLGHWVRLAAVTRKEGVIETFA